MTGKPAPVFLHRPEGVDALQIGGGAQRKDKPVRAVLQTAHGGVLVRAVVRQPDGAFTGEVYGVMPHEPGVARGERVRFEQSQIFSFKGDENVDADLAEMARVFEEGWHALEADTGKERGYGHAAPEAEAKPGAAAAGAGAQPDRSAATRGTERPARKQAPVGAAREQAGEEMSIGDAMAILCPAGHGRRETKEASVENDYSKDGPTERATHTDRPHEPIACMECGALLPPPPPAADPATASHPMRITCPRCGRINDVAEAEAVDLHRQRPHS